MQREEQLNYLIHFLAPQMSIPENNEEKWRLFRSLVNLRRPNPISKEFLQVQDNFLQNEIAAKGITDYRDLTPLQPDIYLWKGDITTLKADAIVNAANSQLLGCFFPCHGCIDNAIHTFAGVQLRLACAKLMREQNHPEATGTAKITPAFNLPSKFVLHTVGPIIHGALTENDRAALFSCYSSCLTLAEQYHLNSIAFCCISTGEFHFPNDIAAQIAIKAVAQYKAQTYSRIKVIFNVFKQTDYDIYYRLLTTN